MNIYIMDNNDDAINMLTFIEHFTYYIKMTIYINKGTHDDKLLDKCIVLYNKLKRIETATQLETEEQAFIRRCLKRLNLVLKVNNNGKVIDIKDKENQKQMIRLQSHPSIESNDMNHMITHATNEKIDIITGIPLMFMLRPSKYQQLLWQYTRSLFYISQILISKNDDEITKDISNSKTQLYDSSYSSLIEVLDSISVIEDEMQMSKLMSLDNFLNSKLLKNGINDRNINDAKLEVKEMFQKKGLGNDTPMGNMIDLISSKLGNTNLTNGSIFQNMFSIAQDVANEMQTDLQKNPDQFQNTLGAITQVFQETISADTALSNSLPPELKDVFKTVLSAAPNGEIDPNFNSQELMANLESVIVSNGLNKNDFMNAKGEIDVQKLESMVATMK